MTEISYLKELLNSPEQAKGKGLRGPSLGVLALTPTLFFLPHHASTIDTLHTEQYGCGVGVISPMDRPMDLPATCACGSVCTHTHTHRDHKPYGEEQQLYTNPTTVSRYTLFAPHIFSPNFSLRIFLARPRASGSALTIKEVSPLEEHHHLLASESHILLR